LFHKRTEAQHFKWTRNVLKRENKC
jgi:hypothetical protein